MPLSEQHKRQKAKNYTTLAVLLFLILLFFVMTLVKVGG